MRRVEEGQMRYLRQMIGCLDRAPDLWGEIPPDLGGMESVSEPVVSIEAARRLFGGMKG